MNWSLPIALMVAVILGSESPGQNKGDSGEKAHGMFQSQEEETQFWTVLKQTKDPEIRASLPMIYDITRGKPIGTTKPWYNAGNQTPLIQVLADPNVRKELGMVDDQYQELRDRSSQLQKQLGEQLRALDLRDTKSAASQIAAIRLRTRQELESVLLPQQLNRLRQIS